ncbi:hypothetical protein [Corynebacterium pilosum]|uniref:Uncharacterized protein n=1 Tax=Corynebacterium pilosum TaxID=35756 RepID=A0A376CKM1_9CORY|nr:hypothetical protein [Corynebacterium pilosum]STC68984.1 Uncharacterised protein [Corynebacterium pilosum]
MTNQSTRVEPPVAYEPRQLEPFEFREETIAKWSPLLVKLTWAAIIIGAIVGMIFFWGVGDVFGQDVGTLVWVLTMGLATALMFLRQLMLAERE